MSLKAEAAFMSLSLTLTLSHKYQQTQIVQSIRKNQPGKGKGAFTPSGAN